MQRQRLAFTVSVAMLAYAVGAASSTFNIYPVPVVRHSVVEVRDFLKHWRNDLGLEPTRHLVPARTTGGKAGATNPAAAMPGLRIVSGYFANRSSRHGAVLLSETGEELRFWPINTGAIKAEMGRHTFLHGFDVLPDGSLVVNFDEGHVLARIDACGGIMWARPGEYHHSVEAAADGTLWAAGSPRESQAISQIDADTGEALFSVRLNDLARGPARGVLQIRRADNENMPVGWLKDRFHLNDVEVLEADIATAHPLFDAGDVMISLRSLNLVAVFSADFKTLKWWQHGPWHRQHDPDFLPDGRIAVYDNNMHGDASRIIEVDPATGATTTRFRGSDTAPFYSWIRGKQQLLPNGNVLVTEPATGSVIEVDSAGAVVWEFQNRFDESRNLLVNNAIWLPQDFFKDGLPQCGKS